MITAWRYVLLMLITTLIATMSTANPVAAEEGQRHRVFMYAPWNVVIGQTLQIGGSVKSPVAGQSVVLQLKPRARSPWQSEDSAVIADNGTFDLNKRVTRKYIRRLWVRVVRPKTANSPRETSRTLKVGVKRWNGKLRAIVLWDGPANVDVRLVEPGGSIISGSRPGPSRSGGRISNGSHRGCGSTDSENSQYEQISWPGRAKARRGNYTIQVVVVDTCGALSTVPWRLAVKANGVRISSVPREGISDSSVFRFGGKSSW